MSRYLMRYKGTYRLKADIDERLHDFPRLDDGSIDPSFDDIYIKCKANSKIYHYGHSTLVAYIPSIGRGRNILRAMGVELLNKEYKDMNKLYSALETEGTISNIVETDEEVEFKFNISKLDFIAKFLQPQTSGANISPFSPKNLPKAKYSIPEADLSTYKEITGCLDQSHILVLSHLTTRFTETVLAKDKLYKTVPIKTDMRQKMLKGKEYIHSMGYWDKYLKYLKKELKDYE